VLLELADVLLELADALLELADPLLGLFCAANRLGKSLLAGGGRRRRCALERALPLFEARALLLDCVGDAAQRDFAMRQLGEPLGERIVVGGRGQRFVRRSPITL
jgi:hypothetical protein